jgi:hypothetical protein
MMIDLDAEVSVNGTDMRVRDIPYPDSILFGIGHDPGYKLEKREVRPGEWPFTPEACQVAGELTGHTRWTENDTVLVCTGCGLDCT